MKYVTVKICRDTFQQSLTPEQKDYLRRVTDPQDLNEALESVRQDKLIERMQKILEEELDKRIHNIFFPPDLV